MQDLKLSPRTEFCAIAIATYLWPINRIYNSDHRRLNRWQF